MGNREPLQVSREGIRTICFVFFRKIIVNSLEDSPKWVGETCQTSCLGKNKKPVGTVSGDLPVANITKKKKKSKTYEEAKSTPNQDHLILLHARCIMGITTNHTLKSLIFLC